jgi:hypothetical protein
MSPSDLLLGPYYRNVFSNKKYFPSIVFFILEFYKTARQQILKFLATNPEIEHTANCYKEHTREWCGKRMAKCVLPS